MSTTANDPLAIQAGSAHEVNGMPAASENMLRQVILSVTRDKGVSTSEETPQQRELARTIIGLVRELMDALGSDELAIAESFSEGFIVRRLKFDARSPNEPTGPLPPLDPEYEAELQRRLETLEDSDVICEFVLDEPTDDE